MRQVMVGISIFVLAVAFAGQMRAEGAAEAARPLKVSVLAGQSNMVGAGADIARLPEEYKGAVAGVLFFDGKGWIPLEPGKTLVAQTSALQKQFGPEIGFGRAMSKAMGEPIGIIKLSAGGTNLAKQWSPAEKDSLYAKLLNLVKEAKGSRPIQIVGMAWMQGERDSRDEEMAKAYAANFGNFIRTARKDFQSPEMAFVAGRINPKYPYVDLVRKAQMECAEAHYAWVDCDGLSKGADHLHYDTAGQLKLGEEFAAAMLKLMKGKE